jgi:hypothetical protein
LETTRNLGGISFEGILSIIRSKIHKAQDFSLET